MEICYADICTKADGEPGFFWSVSRGMMGYMLGDGGRVDLGSEIGELE